jgi:hypothetical protein
MSIDKSLQPLLDIISTLDFEEFGLLALASAEWDGNDLTLHLAVERKDEEDEVWRLHCANVRRSRIGNDQGIGSLSVETRHPLLLPHTEPVADLYFSSRPADPDATVGRLLEAHHSAVRRWFDFLHFFNLGPDQSLRALLAGGFGKLAQGPQSLIGRYAEVLRGVGVAVSSPPSWAPVWWDGTRWVQEVDPLFVVILGGSYVVAPTVTAERK